MTVTGKYGKTRELPLHQAVTGQLAGYLAGRSARSPGRSCCGFPGLTTP